jgi:hypothetical protein
MVQQVVCYYTVKQLHVWLHSVVSWRRMYTPLALRFKLSACDSSFALFEQSIEE